MEFNQMNAIRAFNSGNANPSNQQPAIDPALQGPQPSQGNELTADILTNATPSNRPDDFYKPKHNIPCTWEGCGRMFTCNHNVQQHIRETHTGERPHVCAICAARGIDSRYARPGTLYRHIRSQHKIEPDVKNKRGPRKTLLSTGPVSAVPVPAPAPAQQPKKRGRKPKSATQQDDPAPEPAQMQPVAFDQSCEFCGAELTGAEHALLHLHLEHSVPASPECGCSFCKSQLMPRVPLEQFEPSGLLPPMPQQPAAFSPQVQQPQPRRAVSPSQLEQRLFAVQQQQQQLFTQSTETLGADDESAPPFDPAPTPGLDGSEQQMWSAPPEQDPSGFIDNSEFAGDFGKLSDNLDDLFPELGDMTKTSEYPDF